MEFLLCPSLIPPEGEGAFYTAHGDSDNKPPFPREGAVRAFSVRPEEPGWQPEGLRGWQRWNLCHERRSGNPGRESLQAIRQEVHTAGAGRVLAFSAHDRGSVPAECGMEPLLRGAATGHALGQYSGLEGTACPGEGGGHRGLMRRLLLPRACKTPCWKISAAMPEAAAFWGESISR